MNIYQPREGSHWPMRQYVHAPIRSSLSTQLQFKGASDDQEEVHLNQHKGKSLIHWGGMFLLRSLRLSSLDHSLKEYLLIKKRFASTNVWGSRQFTEAVCLCFDSFVSQQPSRVLFLSLFCPSETILTMTTSLLFCCAKNYNPPFVTASQHPCQDHSAQLVP